jgi:hypothetical protein
VQQTRTVAPRARSASIQPRASRMPSGSSPLPARRDEQRRRAEQRVREAEQLAQPLRERRNRLVRAIGDPGALERGRCGGVRLAVGEPDQLRVQREPLRGRRAARQREPLGQQSESGARGRLLRRMALQRDRSRARAREAEREPQRCGLARAVRPEQTPAAAHGNAQLEPFQRVAAAVALGGAAPLDRVHHA